MIGAEYYEFSGATSVQNKVESCICNRYFWYSDFVCAKIEVTSHIYLQIYDTYIFHDYQLRNGNIFKQQHKVTVDILPPVIACERESEGERDDDDDDDDDA